MADDWEDWEADDYQPTLPAKPATTAPAKEFDTIGAAQLAQVFEPDMSKFKDEDTLPEPEPDYSIKPQPKKKVEKKYDLGEEVEQPLDDPIAEKLRRQRLVEESDFRAAQELFGGAGSGKGLDSQLPKSVKDFEEYAAAVAAKYVIPHVSSKNYRSLVKALLKLMMESMDAEEAKEVEAAAASVRVEKVKAEKAAAAAKAKAKKSVNVGRQGGSAGLDDYIYDEALDDDVDFM